MNKHFTIFALLLVSLFLINHGCGENSHNETPTPAALDLNGSKQGQTVGLADVDGDGIDDKIVGAPHASFSANTGAVLVYRGSATGYAPVFGLVLVGDDNFGFSFANLGDADGDGKDDFAVGAINGNGSGVTQPSLCGSVSVYKGGSNGQVIQKLSGEQPMDKFGLSLAGGDLNDDGFSDVIVGAPFNTNDPALYQQGAVYVFFGPDFSEKISLHASSKTGGLGWTVAAGDINGDAVADLLVSANGKVLGYYGGASFSPVLDSPHFTASASMSGFGKSVKVMGDVDGDGMNEIAIGAPNAVISGKRDTGRLYIVKGGAGERALDLNSDPAPPDLIAGIDGNNSFDRFGSSITPVNMGIDEKPGIAVGAPMADASFNDMSGKVYLFHGKSLNANTTLANASVFVGGLKNQGYGTAVSSDGTGRILVGAPRSAVDTGDTYVIDDSVAPVVSGDGAEEDAGPVGCF
jgi:hypothetical protein